ncbi:2-isopropylmalate synthase [Pelomyxa schiedti]|nr:2-isopropylmalate synthase [Pelomyxa schiedti]
MSTNGFDTSALSGGATYTGRVVAGKRDGRANCKWPDGHSYDGVWLNGAMNGRGLLKWPNGGTWEGEWLNGKKDGWGVAHRADGRWYEGLYRDNHWKRGTWHDNNGVDVRDGEWVWNATANGYDMQGWGVQRRMTTKGGSTVKMVVTVYEGEWDSDKWHGVGTWISPDGSGDIYHGQFYHGMKCGTGSILFGGGNNSNPEGSGGGSYVGEWKDDVFHGRGVRLWANGDRYDGQWVQGKEHGEGTKTWSRDGSSFTGLESNEELASHLKKLTELKGTLVMKLNESDYACKKLLGQTLTVQNSESEIQECARNISTLTKKVLGIRSSATSTSSTSEMETVPKEEEGHHNNTVDDILLKPLLTVNDPQPHTFTPPFQLLCTLSDTLAQLQRCQFDECTKLADKHTVLSKELSEQVSIGGTLQKAIEDIQRECSELQREHKGKWRLKRGLEGDEKFIGMPCVWSILSELLPQAQQAIVDLMVSKAMLTSSSCGGSQQQPRSSMTTAGGTTLPGCTATSPVSPAASLSSVPNHSDVCMECDERPPDVQLQPCGHVVLCSQVSLTDATQGTALLRFSSGFRLFIVPPPAFLNCRCSSNLPAAEMKACHHQEGKCEDCPCPFLHFWHFVTSFWLVLADLPPQSMTKDPGCQKG